MPRARPCRRLRLSCTAGGTVTPGKTTGCSRQRSKALLTIFHGLRRSKCEEPNSSCDDRCNAPIIRRECSALLFFCSLSFHVGNIRNSVGFWVCGAGSRAEISSRRLLRRDYFPQFDGYRLAVALPAFCEPLAHGLRQALRIYCEACFEPPVGGRQRVVKFRRASEIPHAETIQPIERRGAPLVANHQFRLQLARIHDSRIIAFGRISV